jgi:SAM-dependent methyltransferase
MNYQQIDPDLPSISRWIKLNRKYPGESTLRMMEYEALEKVSLTGKMLDLGGGEKSKYRAKLPKEVEYFSVNIDPEIEPTWLVEPGKPLPVEDNFFDCCISMNTLEHVYDPKALVEEIYRSLKPGGTVYITVPWIFRIHGHPYDFNRMAPSWWETTMETVGFSEASVLPLIWGRYSTGASIVGHRGLFKSIRRHIPHINDVIYATFARSGADGKYSGKRGQRICNVAPGHFISATK